MYRVLRSLWFTTEPNSFVELEDGVFLVKFGRVDDREKILGMVPSLFDQCFLSMVPFEKDNSPSKYNFVQVPYWIRIYNVPLECMERNVTLELGGAIREVLAIDWRDCKGCWTKYMSVRIKLDTSRPLRRVIYVVNREGKEIICGIKYKRLPSFCYICGRISHNTQHCGQYT